MQATTEIANQSTKASAVSKNIYYSYDTKNNFIYSTGTITIDTSGDAPTITVDGNLVKTGKIVDGVAVFDFNYIELAANTQITITGERPLALNSYTDMVISSSIDVSGEIAGRAGGGAGGAGGDGGAAGVGGDGGSGGNGGLYGSGSYYSGVRGGSGSNGSSGNRGAKGETGSKGQNGQSGFGADDITEATGNGGQGGTANAYYADGGNGGSGGSGGRMGSYGDGYRGNDGTQGTQGENGNSGGSGLSGSMGIDAISNRNADSLDLIAGTGGGGGSGGGGGAGGNGGGGGGAGGGGGGGGGGAIKEINYGVGYINGAHGGVGGSGGNGGKGGSGGDGGNGGAGGTGGNGGGCIVLSARGNLFFDSLINISAGNAQAGQTGNYGGNGSSGKSGGKGFVVHNNGQVGPGHDGGAGGDGGNGGSGGNGGKGGDGGNGGNGGQGTPGMIKLSGSLIFAADGTVISGNGNNDTAADRSGVITYISNMSNLFTEKQKVDFEGALQFGSSTLDDYLKVKSSYSDTLYIPIIGGLENIGAGEYGFCKKDNPTLSISSGMRLDSFSNEIAIYRLSGIYDGFDQIFIQNVTTSTLDKYTLQVGNYSQTVEINNLTADSTWTICVPERMSISLTKSRQEKADLQITSFSVAESIKSGNSLTLNFTIKNNGSATAQASKLYVYDNDIKIGEASIATIKAGGVYKNSYTIAADKLTVGANKIRLVADGGGVVAETNEDNNGYTRTVKVTEDLAPADLIISNFTVASSVKSNEDLLLTVTVKNQGGISAKASRVYVYNDGVKIGDIYIGAVYAGKTYTNSYTIAAGMLKAGDHKIRLVADGANIVPESNNNNNGYTKTVKVTEELAPADLIISSFDIAASAKANENLKLTVTVKNQGGISAKASRVYIYNDGVKIGDIYIGTVYAGKTYTNTYTIAAGRLKAGDRKIRLVADGANIVPESDNNNNGYTKTVTVTEELAPADLIISGFDIAASAKTNEDLKLTVTVKNQGEISAKASRVYVYNDGVKIGDIYIGTVYAGKTYTNTYTIAAGTLKAGDRKIRLVADGANIVPESDNNNNGYTKTVNVTEELAPADLIISGFDIAASAKANEELKLTVTVKNQGGISAKASRVYVYNDGVKIGDIYIGTVYAGKTYTNTYTIAAGTLKAGARKIRLVADGANIVPESDNNNNGYTKTVNVTQAVTPADLVIGSLNAPASVTTSQNVTLTFTTRNTGGTAAASSIAYIYLDGNMIGAAMVNALAAGASAQSTYTISAGMLTAGSHRLRVVADGNNAIVESDNNNNGYTKTVNVTAAPASVMPVLDAAAPLAFEEVLDDAVDTFEFELSASGKVDIDLTLDDVASAKVALFDAAGNEFALNDALTSVDTLSAGLYQVAVSADEETTRKYAVELGIV